ncbi:unnamed protein product [Ectocarpus sp. 6 AP-2014]
MCTLAPWMGDGWESNIARLIDQANRTLSSSANARQNGGGRTASPHRGYRHNPLPLSSAASPSTFRGDRGASYRRGTEGWGASLLLVRDRVGDGGGSGDKFPAPYPPPPAPAPFSRLAEARVDGARIDGMEDRIKLEVQTVVRRDVDQRVSLAERAAEAVRQRVDGLAEEVASLGEIVRRSSATTTAHATALEQLQAGQQRTRSTVTLLETWRADREGWCARTSESLHSLTEDSRALSRRAHTQQKALGEVEVAQEDLAASVKSTRRVGEAASASAMAPIREHFLQEIETIRRRLSALENEAQTTGTAAVSGVDPTMVKSIAVEEASATAEEVWRKAKQYVREQVIEEAKTTADAAAATRIGLELRLAEVERRVSAYGPALETHKKAEGDISREALGVRDTMEALQKRLAENLARIDDELCELRSRHDRNAAKTAATAALSAIEQQQVTQSASDGLDGREDLEPLVKRLDELELLWERKTPTDLTPATVTAPSSAAAEKVEGIAKTVQEMALGAEAASRQRTIFENSLEEVTETLNGHTLKLRCLEGLWRQTGDTDIEKNVKGGANAGDGVSSTRSSSTPDCGRKHQNLEQQQRKQQHLHAGATPVEGHAVAAQTAPAFRTGLSGLLKRLGSNSLSSSQKEVGTNAADKDNEVGLGTQRPSLGETTDSEKKAVPQSDVVDLRTELAAGGGGNENLPLTSGGAAQNDVDQREGSRGRKDSSDSCGKAGSSAYGSSTYDIVFSGEPRESSNGEPQEPATLDEGEQQHGREGNGTPLSPRGNGTTILSPDVEIPAGAKGMGTAKDTPGKASAQSRQQQNLEKTEGEGDCERDGTDLVLPPRTGSTESSAGVPCTTPTATTATAAPTPKSTTTASGNNIAERLNSCSGSALAVATEPGEQGAGQQLEESGGSLEGDSAHSRWSLPESRGIGGIGAAGGLHERRAIWAGAQEDDSVGEQAPSSAESESGDPGEDGKPLSRSRVESYDLQQETGEDFMVPFSPDRPSAASDVAASPDERGPNGDSGVTTRTPQEIEPALGAVVGDVGQSSAADTPTPPASTTGSAAKHAAGGGGSRSGSLLAEWATVNEFIFSDDDEDEAEKNGGAGHGTTTPERSSQQHATSVDDPKGIDDDAGVDEGGSTCTKGASGDERASGGRKDGRDPVGHQGERPRAKGGITKKAFDDWSSSSSDDDGNDDPRRKEPGNGGTHRRDRDEALLNPLGVAQGERPNGSGGEGSDDEERSTPTPGGRRGVVDSACATPAPGAWSAPDFGFSSDDDLDIEFSASERSVERPAGR